jgi:arsenate reductase
MVGVTIYHNPGCSTSRTVLGMIRARGVEPEIIEYLKNPPSRTRLLQLIKAMGVKPRAVLRAKGDIYTVWQNPR